MSATTPAQRDFFTRRFRKLVEPRMESALHIQLVDTLRWCIRPDVIWRHCPNGEHRDIRTAQKLKSMGVLSGSADLEFFYSSALTRRADPLGHHGFDTQKLNTEAGPRILFLELKLPGRKLSEAQAAFALAMRLLGAEFEVACSIDEAIGIVGKRGLIKPGVDVCGMRW